MSFDVEIGIGAGGGDSEVHCDGAEHADIAIQDGRFVDQDVGAGGGEALVFRHVAIEHARGERADVGDGLIGVGEVFVEGGLFGRLPGERPLASR